MERKGRRTRVLSGPKSERCSSCRKALRASSAISVVLALVLLGAVGGGTASLQPAGVVPWVDVENEAEVHVEDLLWMPAGSTVHDGQRVVIESTGTVVVGSGSQGEVHWSGNLVVREGGRLRLEPGAKVEFSGLIEAGRYPIFHIADGAELSRSASSRVDEVLPEWWGARPETADPRDGIALSLQVDGFRESLACYRQNVLQELDDQGLSGWASLQRVEAPPPLTDAPRCNADCLCVMDCTRSIQQAIGFVADGGGQVSFGRGYYVCAGELLLPGEVCLSGMGQITVLLHVPMTPRRADDAPHRAFITAEPDRDPVTGFFDCGGADDAPIPSVRIERMWILGDHTFPWADDPSRSPALPTSVVGVHLNRVNHTTLEDLTISGFRDAALRINYSANCRFDNVWCSSSGTGVKIEGLNADVTDWSYWLQPRSSSLADVSPVAFDVVAVSRQSGGAQSLHYVAVADNGAVIHGKLIAPHFSVLSAAVTAGAEAKATCGSDRVVTAIPAASAAEELVTYQLGGIGMPLPSCEDWLDSETTVVEVKGVSLGDGLADYFVLLSNSQLVHATWDGSSAPVWTLLHPDVGRFSVSSVSDAIQDCADQQSLLYERVGWGMGTIHLVARYIWPDAFHHVFRVPGGQLTNSSIEPIPMQAPAPDAETVPAIASLAATPGGQRDAFVFYRDENGLLAAMEGAYDAASGFYHWEPLADPPTKQSLRVPIDLAPICIATHSGRADLFVVSSGQLLHRWWSEAEGWTGAWRNLTVYSEPLELLGADLEMCRPRNAAAEPHVISTGPNSLDVFLVDVSGRVYRRRYDHRWFDWEAFDLPSLPLEIAVNRGGNWVVHDPQNVPLEVDIELVVNTELAAAAATGVVFLLVRDDRLGTAPVLAAWQDSVTTTLAFSGGRIADNLTGVDIDSALSVTFSNQFVLEGNHWNAVEIDDSRVISFSACYWESNGGHCISAGHDRLVRGLTVRSPIVTGGDGPSATLLGIGGNLDLVADLNLAHAVFPRDKSVPPLGNLGVLVPSSWGSCQACSDTGGICDETIPGVLEAAGSMLVPLSGPFLPDSCYCTMRLDRGSSSKWDVDALNAHRHVFSLDKLTWADLELPRVLNPFQSLLQTTTNSCQIIYRDREE